MAYPFLFRVTTEDPPEAFGSWYMQKFPEGFWAHHWKGMKSGHPHFHALVWLKKSPDAAKPFKKSMEALRNEAKSMFSCTGQMPVGFREIKEENWVKIMHYFVCKNSASKQGHYYAHVDWSATFQKALKFEEEYQESRKSQKEALAECLEATYKDKTCRADDYKAVYKMLGRALLKLKLDQKSHINYRFSDTIVNFMLQKNLEFRKFWVDRQCERALGLL